MPDQTEFTYDVFISHAQADRAWVRDELLKRLEAAGLHVCVDWRNFRPSSPRVKEMESAVLNSNKTLLILTPGFVQSERAEYGELMAQTLDPASRERRFIPLLKERCELPLRIRQITYVNFIDLDE